MQLLPQPMTQIPSRFLCGMVVATLLVLPGCANGDFGEIRPSLVRDDIHDWVALDAIAGKPTLPSQFELTDDERQLRDLAYPLIEPAYDRQQPNSILGEYGVIGADHRAVFDRTAYATRLQSSRYRSPAARYAQLIDDIRNDSTRMPQFFETAARVLDVDGKRQKSLAYVSALSNYERAHAVRRMRENLSIAKLVHAMLGRRLSSYRFALERLVIVTPSSQAVEVERTLNQLQAQIARYRFGAPPGRTRPAQIAIAR
jgi:hypothetical protein